MKVILTRCLFVGLCTALSPFGYSADFDKGLSCYQSGNFSCALEEWHSLADQGDSNSQNALAVMYERGEGIDKNPAEAVKWYRLAAGQGDVGAQHNLGVLYYKGDGVEKNQTESAKWYQLAANQGHAFAQYNLGIMYNKGEGVEQNQTEAAKWYRLAAEQGDADAQNNLGVMFEFGEGVKSNSGAAIYWYAEAAQQGNQMAIENLASISEKQPKLEVIDSVVNIRAETNTNSRIRVQVDKGDILYRIGKTEDWFEVYYQKDHLFGFVADYLVDEVAAQ